MGNETASEPANAVANESAKPTASEAAHGAPIGALDLARRVVDVLSDHKATDIVLLDIAKLASFADYFVICSGTSDRQVKALTDTLTETLESEGVRAKRVEGKPETGWILLDYADVVVHVFNAPTRDYYRLERIWAEAPTILRVQ